MPNHGPTRVYLSPGMFGFARLASFDYFEHLVKAIGDRFAARGRAAEVRVCDVHPTASVRRRAVKLATMIAATAGDDGGPIHIVGHSTGGLDARLVASPSVSLSPSGAPPLSWVDRLCSVTTMNTPHYGTPLATFFATVSGQRLLYAISALTVTALKLGAPPLAATSALVAAMGRVQLRGFELELVDRFVESVVKVLDEAGSRELRAWLKLVRDDQGSIVQLMPEAMDLFQAGIADRRFVKYQCVATYAPENAVRDWLGAMRSPWRALSSATVFTLMYNITARQDARYPCMAPDGTGEQQVRARSSASSAAADRERRHRPALLANLGRAGVGGAGRPPRHRRPLPRPRRPHRLAQQRLPLQPRALRPGHGSHRRRDDRRRGIEADRASRAAVARS